MLRWRELALDGKLLRFDRATGLNQLLSGPETAHLRQQAPRFMHVALTNACNKDCGYCYRPPAADDRWTGGSLLELARWATEWGVLELTFGGGEPTVFDGFDELLRQIWHETPLCPSFTTNGLLLDGAFLQRIAGCYGQIQLSVYDEDEPLAVVELLRRERARFGLNYLVTPRRLPTLEADLCGWVEGAGVRDVLLLSYKGDDADLHLSASECGQLERSINTLHRRFGETVALKVDNCWAERLAGVPQLFLEDDCGASGAFVSVTSDRRVQPCSFHHQSEPFASFDEISAIYGRFRDGKPPAARPGCARRRCFGLAGFEARAAGRPGGAA